MPIGLQTFNADGTMGYDGFSSTLRCSFEMIIPYDESTSYGEVHIPGIYEKVQAGLAKVYVAQWSRLLDSKELITNISPDDYVSYGISGYFRQLVVLEWGGDAAI